MNTVIAAIINTSYKELSNFIVLSNWLDDIAYKKPRIQRTKIKILKYLFAEYNDPPVD